MSSYKESKHKDDVKPVDKPGLAGVPLALAQAFRSTLIRA